jgi:hypothetical protein
MSVLNVVFAWFIVHLIADPCIGPSRTSKIVKTSSKYCTKVQCLAPLRYMLPRENRTADALVELLAECGPAVACLGVDTAPGSRPGHPTVHQSTSGIR